MENEHVRAWEYTYEPGAEGHHVHEFPRLVYIIEGGVLEMVSPTGQVNRLSPTPGVAGWAGPATLTVRNVGTTRVKMLEVEIKGASPQP